VKYMLNETKTYDYRHIDLRRLLRHLAESV
jgi:hypothetical protein